jgi:hypothetical protein
MSPIQLAKDFLKGMAEGAYAVRAVRKEDEDQNSTAKKSEVKQDGEDKSLVCVS